MPYNRYAPARALLMDVNRFSDKAVRIPLLNYQRPIADAIAKLVMQRNGGVITIEMPRQSGKNQISAICEAFLLLKHFRKGGSIIKTAPTYQPQLMISRRRLETILNTCVITKGIWKAKDGNAIQLGRAREIFLSAQPGANVVGATADIALITDETQEIDEEKFDKDFNPMRAWKDAPLIAFGVRWNGETFFENLINQNLETEKKDGVKRHYRVEPDEVISSNDAYKRHFEREVERFGIDHILIRTQYLLESVSALGDMFSPAQLSSMRGDFPRKDMPSDRCRYFAGIDIGGTELMSAKANLENEHDETIMVVMEKSRNRSDEELFLVNCYRWKNEQWEKLHSEILTLLDAWKCEAVVVDGRGIGNACAMWIAEHYKKGKVEVYQSSVRSVSDDGYRLMGYAGLNRMKIFLDENSIKHDGFVSSDEIFRQLGNARRELLKDGSMRFYVPEKYGHDDILKALAYALRASCSLNKNFENVILEAITNRKNGDSPQE